MCINVEVCCLIQYLSLSSMHICMSSCAYAFNILLPSSEVSIASLRVKMTYCCTTATLIQLLFNNDYLVQRLTNFLYQDL